MTVNAPATDIREHPYSTITWEVTDGIGVLTLNRPDRLNAFTPTMADELEDSFTRVNDDDNVSAIIVTGAGRAFCAGMELGEPAAADDPGAPNAFGLVPGLEPTLAQLRENPTDPALLGVRDTGGRVSLAIAACRKPVIAAVNGAAVGIGATMTLPMDFRFVSTKARVGFIFGRLGIVPEACSSYYLPRIVGLPTALEWVYTADIHEPQVLADAGYAHSIHEPEDLLEAAIAFAHRLVDGKSPVAIALSRQMLHTNGADPLEAHYIESLGMYYASFGDGAEGVAAFREKRAANYSGSAAQLPPFYPWLERPQPTAR